MFGKKFSEYIQFERWILILIAAVFVIRLALPLLGTSIGLTRWVSINIVLLVGLVYCSVAVHTARFGGYKQLYGLLLIQTVFAHSLIALGIILGITTGTDNIYTAPEFFGGNSGRNWIHVLMHIIAAVVLPLIVWLIGSVILFATKRLKPAARF
jgi:hypothetical protein